MIVLSASCIPSNSTDVKNKIASTGVNRKAIQPVYAVVVIVLVEFSGAEVFSFLFGIQICLTWKPKKAISLRSRCFLVSNLFEKMMACFTLNIFLFPFPASCHPIPGLEDGGIGVILSNVCPEHFTTSS